MYRNKNYGDPHSDLKVFLFALVFVLGVAWAFNTFVLVPMGAGIF